MKMVISMKNELRYKGYRTLVEYSAEDCCLFGKIIGINDLVLFDAESAGEVEQSFRNAVDGYLEHCREIGKEAEKQYSGTFNIRIDPDSHKKLANRAAEQSKSINQVVGEAVDQYLLEGANMLDAEELYKWFAQPKIITQTMILPSSLLAESWKTMS